MFIILSIIKPYTIPKNIFINNIFSINDISTFSDIIIINISSLVDKYIDINVPSVIILVIYRLVAITEKPHCGITPSREPIIGPTFFDLVIMCFVLLFNLNCIKEYQSTKINVNFHELYPLPYIDMKKDLSTPKLISNRSINYNEIYNYVESIFKELTKDIKVQSFSNYDEFFETIIYYANEALKIATISKEKEIKLIQESLKENNLEIAEKIIIRNIVLNYLSEYLYQEQDKIITLPKTPSSKRKMYKI